MLELLKGNDEDKYISKLINSIPAVLYEYTITPQGDFECFYISSKCKEILGHSPDFFLGDVNRFWSLIKRDDINKILEAKKNSDKISRFFAEVRVNLPVWGERWIQMSALPSGELKHGHTVWRGFLFDITEKKIEEKTLEKIARIDSLTGVYNKRYFYKKIENAIIDFLTFDTKFSVLFIDLDGFKTINDKYGHITGDEILKSFTDKISRLLRPNDYLGRLGGDEFCVLFENTGLKESGNLSSYFREIIEKTPVSSNIGDIYITMSGGVAEIGKDTLNVLSIVEKADKALYMAKNIGKNTIVLAE